MIDLLLSDYRVLAQDLLAFALIGLAFVWGGGPERVVAATWLIIFELGGRLNDLVFGEGLKLTDVDLYWASADLIAGILWFAVALYANRSYTLWIAAMQLLAMTAHLVRGLVESISPIAYVTMVIAPGWVQLFLLAGGLSFHIRRKRAHGPYRDWRHDTNWNDSSFGGNISGRFFTILSHDFFPKKGVH